MTNTHRAQRLTNLHDMASFSDRADLVTIAATYSDDLDFSAWVNDLICTNDRATFRRLLREAMEQFRGSDALAEAPAVLEAIGASLTHDDSRLRDFPDEPEDWDFPA